MQVEPPAQTRGTCFSGIPWRNPKPLAHSSTGSPGAFWFGVTARGNFKPNKNNKTAKYKQGVGLTNLIKCVKFYEQAI